MQANDLDEVDDSGRKESSVNKGSLNQQNACKKIAGSNRTSSKGEHDDFKQAVPKSEDAHSRHAELLSKSDKSRRRKSSAAVEVPERVDDRDEDVLSGCKRFNIGGTTPMQAELRTTDDGLKCAQSSTGNRNTKPNLASPKTETNGSEQA
jgi:hypothetical protein